MEDHSCVQCPYIIHEDIAHLFFSCNFSVRVWDYLQIHWDPQPGMTTYNLVVKARKDFGHVFFTEVVFIAAWNIWMLRNGKVFRNERPSFRA